jgi:antitoxin component YwqK of YwqJK toxin-antitoxin module
MRRTLSICILLLSCTSNHINKDDSLNKPSLKARLRLTCPTQTSLQENELSYWCVDQDLSRVGPSARYYKNGQIAEEGAWRDNAPVGLWSYFKEDGALLAQLDMKDGDGLWLSFHENGVKAAERTYQARVMVGLSLNWSEKGLLTARGAYRDGRMHGTFINYFESNGKVSWQAEYLDGVQHGSAKQYNEAGEVLSERIYYYGEQIEETTYEKGVVIDNKKTSIELPPMDKLQINDKEYSTLQREWRACQEHAQCQLVSTRCCACGSQDYAGVNYKFTAQAQRALPELSCNDHPCPSMMCRKIYAVCDDGYCASAE